MGSGSPLDVHFHPFSESQTTTVFFFILVVRHTYPVNIPLKIPRMLLLLKSASNFQPSTGDAPGAALSSTAVLGAEEAQQQLSISAEARAFGTATPSHHWLNRSYTKMDVG